MGSVFGKVKRLSDEDESSESDEDAKTTPAMNKNFKEDKFWNMPPLLKTSVLDIKKKGMCYGTSSLVRLHDTFDNKEQIKIVLGRKAVEEGFQIRHPRSDPQRVYAKCIVDTYGAVSIASAIKNVFPNAFHGRCCRHLLMYLCEKRTRFISKEELFWKTCKSYRISNFEERFSTLRDWLPSIANKLDMIGLEKLARVHFPDEHKHELTPWAEAKLTQRIAKSATWTTSVWRASYNEVIFDVGHPSEWDQPDGLIIVFPPVMDKRQPGRLRNRDRLRSKGEQITPKSNGGVTHNMIDDIHNHWKKVEAVRIKCLGVPTLGMDNICCRLEDKSGGKIIYRHINILLLYRGRNYDPKNRPVVPLMLWKPYPKLIVSCT
nr:CRS2-associated factor 2, mitochondrial [Tanacetum cinerariifolium]